MSEQVHVKSDQELARDIAFQQAHLAGGLYQEVWVDSEADELAEKCAATGINTGRKAERQLIAYALGIEVAELDRLVGDLDSEENHG